MRRSSWLILPGFCGLLVLAGATGAETQVVVKEVHLCCQGCVKGVGVALKGLEGVKPKCDQEGGTVTIVAPDDATAQKAVDALAAAGYHGVPDSSVVTFKQESNIPSGKVKTIALSNLHNCCRACASAIKSAVKKVDGVTGDTVTPKGAAFEVTGDFDAVALVKALNAAGFHVQVKN
jgi:periplasmic mercuric ion binding protein